MQEDRSHHRRSIRLKGYDYSHPGAYFVTICTHEKRCLFGDVVDGQMRMNGCGKTVHEEWYKSAQIRKEIELDAWTVMPNHVHGIVWIMPTPLPGRVGANGVCPPKGERRSPLPMRPRSLASFVAGFKAATTHRTHETRQSSAGPIWQRNYYEHIIRNQRDLERIREYIASNPLRWPFDPENPNRVEDDEDEYPWES